MANMYNRGLMNVGKEWEWDVDSFKVMLVTSTYTYDADHNFRNQITNEITNTGYTTGGIALTGCDVTQDDVNDQAEYDADDSTFTSLGAGDQPYAAITYRNVGTPETDDLISYNTLSTPPAPDGNNYKIVWNAEGVFKLAN